MLKISTSLDPKKLRQFIIMLLKSKAATQIKKANYISSYQIDETNPKKINKIQEKILIIFFEETKKEKLMSLLNKQENIKILQLPSPIVGEK